MKHAVILAAGSGSRLGEAAQGLPKCLVRVGPCALIEHQIRMLTDVGIQRITVVTGHCADQVRAACGDRCDYVHNPRFNQTNSLYSLWLARKAVQGPFWLLNCDVMFAPTILDRLEYAPGSALAYDSLSGSDPEHMKVAVRDGLVCGISKTMARRAVRGENLGVLKFDAPTAESLFRAASQLVALGQDQAWAPAALDLITVEADIRAVDVCDIPWGEIDFPGDLDEARNRIWPAIQALGTEPVSETQPQSPARHGQSACESASTTTNSTANGILTSERPHMSCHDQVSVLFTGYAWVHFACFRPIYDRLRLIPGVEVFVSGGLRSEEEAEGSDDKVKVYDLRGMYDPFGIPDEAMLTVEQIKERDFDVVFSANTKMILPRSQRARIQIFHGISFRNRAVREENQGADWYFIVGPYMRRAFAEAGILPENDPRALKIGFPKTDPLLNGELDRGQILRRLGLSGHRPVILYAPTGQKKNSLETMGEEVIERIAATGRYDLVIKPHDHPKNTINWDERLAPLLNEHTKLVRDPDVIPLLLVADLLMTDASSVSSEFSLRDQPMVFLDVPDLLAKASASGGSKVDLKTWGRRCGVLVEQPDDVVAAIDSSLSHPYRYSEVRRAMGQDLFYNAGHAADAAMAWFTRKFIPSRTVPAST